MENVPFLLGTWKLRDTNDNKFKINYTFLKLKYDDTVIVKSIDLEGLLFATKISRSGKLKYIKNNNKIFNYNLDNIYKKINLIKETNNLDLEIDFNMIDKYSYSIFGIEMPKFRYYQNNKNYGSLKKINVKQRDTSLYIIDNETKDYYLFDLCTDTNRLPYIETPLNTFLFSQLLSFLINLTLVKFIGFRAVRILNAGLMTKKIFIALLIKEFLNSK